MWRFSVIIEKGNYYINIPVTIIASCIIMYMVHFRHKHLPIVFADCVLIVLMLLIAQSDIYSKKIPNLYVLLMFIPILIDILWLKSIPTTDRIFGFFCMAIPFFVLKMISPGGIGGGDIKILTVSGILLGARVATALLISSLLAGISVIIMMIMKIKRRDSKIALGPFLAIGILYCYMFLD